MKTVSEDTPVMFNPPTDLRNYQLVKTPFVYAICDRHPQWRQQVADQIREYRALRHTFNLPRLRLADDPGTYTAEDRTGTTFYIHNWCWSETITPRAIAHRPPVPTCQFLWRIEIESMTSGDYMNPPESYEVPLVDAADITRAMLMAQSMLHLHILGNIQADRALGEMYQDDDFEF